MTRNESPANFVGLTDQPSSGFHTVNESEIVVGIPTYNEEVAIGSIVLQAQQHADEVVVIDDGSTDQTVAIAAEAGATVFKHSENKGKGGAIRSLLNHMQNRSMDALVLLDGDGQHAPQDIPAVAEPVVANNCDIAIGSRYIDTGADETPSYRRFGQRVLDVLTFGPSGTQITDSQSGFRALSPEAVSNLTIRADGMGVESEMIGEASENGLAIAEVPVDVRYEGLDGQTHNPLRHGLSVVVFITQLIRDRHPLMFFGVPGLIMLGLGGGLGLHTSYLYQTTGAFHQWRILVSGFAILLGTIGVFCGLVLSQVQNMVSEIDG